MRRLLRSIPFWLVVAVVVAIVAISALRGGTDRESLRLDELLDRVVNGQVASATIKDQDHTVVGELTNGTEFKANYPAEFSDELVDTFTAQQPPLEFEVDQQRESVWIGLLYSLLPGTSCFLLLPDPHAVSSARKGGGKSADAEERVTKRPPRHL